MISDSARGSTALAFAVFGLTIHLIVILTVAAKRRLHTIHYFLLANLSVSDFILNILVIFLGVSQLKERWVFGMAWCKGTSYLIRCVFTTSIILLCAVTWECHTAVVTPFAFSSDITAKKTTVVALLWIGSFFVTALPLFGMAKLAYNDVTYRCVFKDINGNKILSKLLLSILVYFIIPFGIGLIAKQQYQIHRHIKRQKLMMVQQQLAINANIRSSQQHQILIKSIKESKDALIIFIAFLVSYLPLFVVVILLARVEENETLDMAWFLAKVLSQIGSTWNPIIYCFRKREFRQQLFHFGRPLLCISRAPRVAPQRPT